MSLKIPPNDRSSIDLPRLLCSVIEVKRGDSYRLRYIAVCYIDYHLCEVHVHMIYSQP